MVELPLHPESVASTGHIPESFLLASISPDQLEARALDALFQEMMEGDTSSADAVSWLLRGFWNLDKTPTLAGIDVTRPLFVGMWLPEPNPAEESLAFGGLPDPQSLPMCVGITVVLPAYDTVEASATAKAWIQTFDRSSPEAWPEKLPNLPPKTRVYLAGSKPVAVIEHSDSVRMETCVPFVSVSSDEALKRTWDVVRRRLQPKTTQRVSTPALRHFQANRGAVRLHTSMHALRRWILLSGYLENASFLDGVSPQQFWPFHSQTTEQAYATARRLSDSEQYTYDASLSFILSDSVRAELTETLTPRGMRALQDAKKHSAPAAFVEDTSKTFLSLQSALSFKAYHDENPNPLWLEGTKTPADIERHIKRNVSELELTYHGLNAPLQALSRFALPETLFPQSVSLTIDASLPKTRRADFEPFELNLVASAISTRGEDPCIALAVIRGAIPGLECSVWSQHDQQWFSLASTNKATQHATHHVSKTLTPLARFHLNLGFLKRTLGPDQPDLKDLPNIESLLGRVDLDGSTLSTTLLATTPQTPKEHLSAPRPLLVAGTTPPPPPSSPGFDCLRTYAHRAHEHLSFGKFLDPLQSYTLMTADNFVQPSTDPDLTCALNDPKSAPYARTVRGSHLDLLARRAYTIWGPSTAWPLFQRACDFAYTPSCTTIRALPKTYSQLYTSLPTSNIPHTPLPASPLIISITPSTVSLDRSFATIERNRWSLFDTDPQRNVLSAPYTTGEDVRNFIRTAYRNNLLRPTVDPSSLRSRSIFDEEEPAPSNIVLIAPDPSVPIATLTNILNFLHNNNIPVAFLTRNTQSHLAMQSIFPPPSKQALTSKQPGQLFIRVTPQNYTIQTTLPDGSPFSETVTHTGPLPAKIIFSQHRKRIENLPFSVFVESTDPTVPFGHAAPIFFYAPHTSKPSPHPHLHPARRVILH